MEQVTISDLVEQRSAVNLYRWRVAATEQVNVAASHVMVCPAQVLRLDGILRLDGAVRVGT